ncbi:hypothetical protein GALMADRAFT_223993 [Galerina marginata CBS 339.88]|uniref:EXPERA domain-containing protein n=1 Tax=Galerina marginata (strain CBS 339.88) TaxID=685588 RepID=A0A067TID0_GALM3|nr:hypothetical protein GALMADRAFT_223993 [Galerina marginata CBS 339.88]
MTPKKYTWISLWFLITAPIILWDAGYVLMRPRSMEGGDLRWFWSGFDTYERIDNVYSVKGYHEKAGFAPAAAVSNLIETSLNLIYLYSVYLSPRNIAPLFGFAGAGLTLSKTTIWVLQEYFCGLCSRTETSDFYEILKFWIAPNVVWFTLCSLIVVRLGRDISASLSRPSPKERGSKTF